VDATLRVHPYEEVKNLIDSVDFIGLGQCACRISLHQCDKPTETCFFFDAPARFLVDKKCARQVTREEAHAVLKRAKKKAWFIPAPTAPTDKLSLQLLSVLLHHT